MWLLYFTLHIHIFLKDFFLRYMITRFWNTGLEWVQWLRTLAENSSLILSMHARRLSIACNSSSMGLQASSNTTLLCINLLTDILKHTVFQKDFSSRGSSSACLPFTHLATRSLFHSTASFGYLVCGLVCMGMHNSFVEARVPDRYPHVSPCLWQDLLFAAASTSLDSTWVSWALFVSTCRLPVQILHYRCVDFPLAFYSIWRIEFWYSHCIASALSFEAQPWKDAIKFWDHISSTVQIHFF